MSSSVAPSNLYRHTGTTSETPVSTVPSILLAIVPNATTTGTITLRDSATTGGSNVKEVAAIGLTQSGKQYGPFGVRFDSGITVQNSVSGDIAGIVWMPL